MCSFIIRAIGSPGTTSSRMNVRKVVAMITGTAWASRRMMYLSMAAFYGIPVVNASPPSTEEPKVHEVLLVFV